MKTVILSWLKYHRNGVLIIDQLKKKKNFADARPVSGQNIGKNHLPLSWSIENSYFHQLLLKYFKPVTFSRLTMKDAESEGTVRGFSSPPNRLMLVDPCIWCLGIEEGLTGSLLW